MLDFLLSCSSEFLITALLVLSPARIVRRLACNIPLQAKPKNFANRLVMIFIDCMVWGGIAFLVIMLRE